MDYKVIFSSYTVDELKDSYGWYEEKQAGLGERFLNIIESSVLSISKHPEAFSIRVNRFREYVVPKFPYVIVYELDHKNGLIYILHIFNTYLNPKKK